MNIDLVLYTLVISLQSVFTLILISLGLSIIFGVMGVINFAHGEFLMAGAYVVVVGLGAGLPLPVCILLAPVIVGLIGLAIERLIIRHLYGRLIDTVLATWGISMIMVQVTLVIFGTATPMVTGVPLGVRHIGVYGVSEYAFVVMAVTTSLMVMIYLLLSRTRYGIEAQAVTQSPQIASAMGINAERTMMLTFVLGAALAGLAGGLIAPTVGVVPTMGTIFIIRAFMAVVVGGQAVLSGLAAASGLLGTGQNIVSTITQPFLGQGALLLIALVVLRLMPMGLSGRWRRQL